MAIKLCKERFFFFLAATSVDAREWALSAPVQTSKCNLWLHLCDAGPQAVICISHNKGLQGLQV